MKLGCRIVFRETTILGEKTCYTLIFNHLVLASEKESNLSAWVGRNGGIGIGDEGKESSTGVQGGENQVKMEPLTIACEREPKPCNVVNNAEGNNIIVRIFWMLKSIFVGQAYHENYSLHKYLSTTNI